LLSAHREHGEETGVRTKSRLCRSGGNGVVRRASSLSRTRQRAIATGARSHVRRWRELSRKVKGLMVLLPPVERANVILPSTRSWSAQILNFVQHRAKRQLVNRPARESCCMGRTAPERPIPFATSPATCPATRR
jgi:hypothetical protein